MYAMTYSSKKKSKLIPAIKIATALSISIFFIIASIKIGLNAKPLYSFDVNKLNITQSVNMNKATLMKNYDLLLSYINNRNISVLALPDFPFSKDGLIHFKEVKNIFMNLDIVFYVTLILGILGSIYCVKKAALSYIKWSSILLIVIPIILSIPFIINFNASFIIFHKLAFSNNYWLLDPSTDPIINALPEAFFMHTAFLILLCIVIFSVLLFTIYRILKKVMADD
ncbi:TIGR01906 family membrane protein [Clostridium oryzae]|uniref:Integral membrane protein n=1 Tax=Clostridium oryzae TaxID=1450648 RepID=A0A1V4INV8_9CLOT|nr:TIGR01906 family membrane protein [Clostridium oryzae]OPJ61524.1 hypothetical protein CLORY_22060 [Clostridium oryzae]